MRFYSGLRPFCSTALLLGFFLLCGLQGTPYAAEQQSLFVKGTFAGMETGDLTYLRIDSNGKRLAFVCDVVIIDAIAGAKPTLPIIIEYAIQKEFHEGAGEEVSFEVVKRVYIPDEYAPGYGIRIESTALPAGQ